MEPKVGMPVTVTLYTDRITYTIVRVTPSGKSFWAVKDDVKKRPGSEEHSQEWEFAEGTGTPECFRKTKTGWSVKGNNRVTVGVRNYYYTWEF